MARGRRWTEDEDRAIRSAAALNKAAVAASVAGEAAVVAAIGLGGRGRRGRLREVADAFGRTYGAVRARAVRLGATSR